MNNLGGPVIEMLSVFIPCIFKLKGKSETSAKNVQNQISKIISYFF